MATTHKRLGEYLIERGKITPRQLDQALQIQANSLQSGQTPLLGSILVEQMHVLNNDDLIAAVELQESESARAMRA